MKRQKGWVLLLLLFVILFAVESFAAYYLLTSRVPGANDYYSRWAGARALLLEGRDPYGLDVTAEIQPVIGIDPSEVGRGGFAYPLHVVFLFWPLVYLSYTWAQAVWLVMLQWFAIGIALGLSARARWRPQPILLTGLILGALSFYPVTRSIFLGQFTLPVTFFLVMALLALNRGRDGWAGVFLSATSIKPQMVIFIAPWLLLWAIGRRRWRFVAGLIGGGLAFLAASLALFPRWPISFSEDVQRYSKVAGGQNPLQLLLETVWPGNPPFAFYLPAGLLVMGMLWAWRRGWQDAGSLAERALHWTIVVSLIVTFQTGTTNQVLLLIPFFNRLYRMGKRGARLPAALVATAVSVAIWTLFLSTIKGNFENLVLFLPLPFLALAVLILQEVVYWRTSRDTAVSQSSHSL